MKKIVKAIMLSAPAILAGTALAAGVDPNPATQPATQPAPQLQTAQNNVPLVIPDGTSGPVMDRGMMQLQGMNGLRR